MLAEEGEKQGGRKLRLLERGSQLLERGRNGEPAVLKREKQKASCARKREK